MIPPTDPFHYRLWLMGFDQEQRATIIEQFKRMTACGIDCDVIGFALVLARFMPMVLDKLEIKTTERN